jgi:putative spermidine/putrescine transport system permease protein
MPDRTNRRMPLGWRLFDWAEAGLAAIWPFRTRRAVAWAFLLPALLLVGLLVIGLGYMIEYSLHELDLATYRLREEYSVANYLYLVERPTYPRILWRTFVAAVIVTAVTVALAFPYAYVLVRTPSAALRKLLLVALFLPFFIGQVVRAYGWLIILGREGLINQASDGHRAGAGLT